MKCDAKVELVPNHAGKNFLDKKSLEADNIANIGFITDNNAISDPPMSPRRSMQKPMTSVFVWIAGGDGMLDTSPPPIRNPRLGGATIVLTHYFQMPDAETQTRQKNQFGSLLLHPQQLELRDRRSREILVPLFGTTYSCQLAYETFLSCTIFGPAKYYALINIWI